MSEIVPRIWTRMEIVQAASESVAESRAKIGMFRDTDSGKHFKTVDVTLIFIQEYGVYFGTNQLGATPRCQTLNRIVPASFVKDPISKSCLTCPKNVWPEGGRPDCKEKRILYMVDNKTMTPYDLILAGTSVKPTKVLKAKIDQQIAVSKLRKQELALWDFKVTLALVPGKKGGNYSEIDYRNLVQRKDAGQVPELAEFAKLALPQAA